MLDIREYEGVIKYVLRKWNLPWDRFYDMAYEALEHSIQRYDASKLGNMKPQTFLIYGVEIYLGNMIGKDFQDRGIVEHHKLRHYKWYLGNYHGLIGGASSLEELADRQMEPKLYDDYSEISVSIFYEEYLTPREKEIVRYRVSGYTFQEIGDTVGYTKETIRIILNKVKKKMIKFFGEERCSGRTIKREKSERVMNRCELHMET